MKINFLEKVRNNKDKLRKLLRFKFRNELIRKPIIVIEIGNDWLKIVENGFSLSGRSITRLNLVKLVQIKESVPCALAKIFGELNLDKYSVITYLPRHLATIRVLEFPSTNLEEINDIVNLQVGKQTPYSREEIISAHKQLPIPSKEGCSKVMLVIARRKLITDRIEALTVAGIDIERVGVSSQGICNWFRIAYSSEIKEEIPRAVIVDIDSNFSDFIVMHNNEMVFTRNILIGANHLIEAMSDWQDKFISELRYSMELYYGEEKAASATKLFFSGASRNIKGLTEEVSSKLDVSVEVIDTARNMRINKDINILTREEYKFVSVSALLGAAVNYKDDSFDLTPKEWRLKKMMEGKRKQLMIMGVLSAAIVMMISLLVLTNIYNKISYLSQIKKKVAQIDNEATKIERMRMHIDLVEKRLAAEGSSVNILDEIYRLVPNEIFLTSINITEKSQTVLKGRSFAMSDVFKFVSTLESSDMFENVKTTYTTTKKVEETEYADFEIIAIYQSK